jgi:hypothetical protein
MSTWLLVIIATVVVVPAPWLHLLSRRSPTFVAALDGFTLLAVCGLVLLELLPQSFEVVGAGAVLVAVAGFVLPNILERVDARLHRGTHTWLAATGLIGLAVHSMLDGVALAMPMLEHAGHAGHSHHHHDELSGTGSTVWAVLMHRLPLGMVLWGLVAPRFGTKMAVAVLSLDAAGLLVGAAAGTMLLPMADSHALMFFQAFVGGSLLHVLMHRHQSSGGTAASRQRARRAELAGALVGGVLLYWMVQQHASPVDVLSSPGFGHRLVDLWLESAPALLIGCLAAGMLTWVLPQLPQAWLNGGGSLGQSLRGVVFGLPLPICSCGVVPMYSAMVRRGVPPAAGMAFLVATPELGVESLLLGLPLLGLPLTMARLAAAAVVALGVGMIVGRLVSRQSAHALPMSTVAPDLTWPERLRRGLHYGFVEVVDDTAIWIVAGLLIAATVSAESLSALVTVLPGGLDVIVFALVGLPLYVCASGATPLAAALLFAGVSPGAAVAFLLAGPATNVTTFAVLSQLHGRKVALVFAATVFALAVGSGLAINALGVPAMGIMAGDEAHSHAHAWGIAASAVMAAAFAWSVIRQGVRGFLHPLVSMGGHSHDHGHGHSPSHGESACCGPECDEPDAVVNHQACCGVEPAPPRMELVRSPGAVKAFGVASKAQRFRPHRPTAREKEP